MYLETVVWSIHLTESIVAAVAFPKRPPIGPTVTLSQVWPVAGYRGLNTRKIRWESGCLIFGR